MKWFVADTHFNHKSMLLEDVCDRPFKNVWEMNACMIDNWNSVINKGDVVYFAGDFALPDKGDGNDIGWIIDQLQGHIHLIRGNHDYKNIRKKLEVKFETAKDLDYIKGDGDDKKYRIMICHYPMRTWRASVHGSWHLHGHSHGKLEPVGKMLDVGVDAHNFKPLSFDQIKDIIMSKETSNEDEKEKRNG